MIPKKIHYCWYGNKKPNSILKCMQSWKILDDYRIKEWNESNCDFEANEFVRTAAKYQKWGYIGDYFRYLALYQEGGIYLDTDVKVLHKFDELLKHRAFMGYIFDSSMGTAILGFEKKHPLLKKILEIYQNTKWIDEYHIESVLPSRKKIVSKVSNDLLTGLLLDIYPEFVLNGKRQVIGEDILILPKEELELGHIGIRGGYCIHKCEGSWDKMSLKKKINASIKKAAALVPGINLDIALRTVTYKYYNKTTPYYSIYLQNKGK